ncbi:MAG: hypothetical protein IPP63_08360 [Chloracidobacterium sp.]|nr:hypothetical protein [Chloracidobacterium sp.]
MALSKETYIIPPATKEMRLTFDSAGTAFARSRQGLDILDVQTGDSRIAAWVNIRSNGTHFIAGKEFGNGSYAQSSGPRPYFICLKMGPINTSIPAMTRLYNTGTTLPECANGMISVLSTVAKKSKSRHLQTHWFRIPATSTIGGPVYLSEPQPIQRTDRRRAFCATCADSAMQSNRDIQRFRFAARIRGEEAGGVIPIAGAGLPGSADPAVELRSIGRILLRPAGRPASLFTKGRCFRRRDDRGPAYPNRGSLTDHRSVGSCKATIKSILTLLQRRLPEYLGDVIATSGTETARVTVAIGAAPDVAVSNFVAPPTVAILPNFTASWRVTNNSQNCDGRLSDEHALHFDRQRIVQ